MSFNIPFQVSKPFIPLTREITTLASLTGIGEKLRLTPAAGKRLMLVGLTSSTLISLDFEKSDSGVVFGGTFSGNTPFDVGEPPIIGQVDEEFIFTQTAAGNNENFTVTYYTEV